MQARAQAELDGLAGHREGAADDGLAGDDRRRSGEHHQRHLQDQRAQYEERISVGRNRPIHNHGGLAGIVQEQCRQHQSIPADPDRPWTEMTHVGVQGFGTRSAQEDGTQHQKSGHSVPEQVGKPVTRIERRKHAGMAPDTRQSQHPDSDEPHRHNRPEQLTNSRGAQGLQAKHTDQDDNRQRQHIGSERRQRRFDTFKRAQHRNGRRYGAVAIEQRRSQYADRDDADAFAMLDAEQRHQGQNTALAVIVGAHDDRDVFDRGGDDERPHDQRQHAECYLGRGSAAGPLNRGLERVEGAGADIPVDDTERPQRHDGKVAAAGIRLSIR